MPAFLEDKLKARYGADSAVPFKIMNSIGAMRGNQETPLGRHMQMKHERDAALRSTIRSRVSKMAGRP